MEAVCSVLVASTIILRVKNFAASVEHSSRPCALRVEPQTLLAKSSAAIAERRLPRR
jgi:hypothetical protein